MPITPMEISYGIEEQPEAPEVVDLFRHSGIRRPDQDLMPIAKMIPNAKLIVCAGDQGKLARIARDPTDFSRCSYLSDLRVSGEQQWQVTGQDLVRRACQAAGQETNLLRRGWRS